MESLGDNLMKNSETEPLKEEDYTKEYISNSDTRPLIRETMNSLRKKTITLEFYQRIWTYKQRIEEAKRRKGLTQLQRDVEEVFEVKFAS